MSNKPNPAAIVRVHRPELTPEERERRMARISQTAADLVVAANKLHRRN